MASKLAITGYTITGIAISLFTWEHLAKIYQSSFKPSTMLKNIADYSVHFWSSLGKYVAILSSFYHMINVDELWKTFQELFEPIFRFLVSPLYSIKGYFDQTGKYSYPIVIIAGTITILLATRYLIKKYTGKDIFNLMLGQPTRSVPPVQTATPHSSMQHHQTKQQIQTEDTDE